MCKDLDRLLQGTGHGYSSVVCYRACGDIGRNKVIEITATHIFVFALIQAVLKI